MTNNLSEIRESLSHVALKWRPSTFLDTKLPDLNQVLGHAVKGIPYGRIIEISGWESNGKTSIILSVAALAQRDGALVIWGDVENSFDAGWARTRGFCLCPKCSGTGMVKDKECSACGGPDAPTCGLDTDKLVLIQPYVGRFSYKDKFGKTHMEKDPRLSTAQELCAEMEGAMQVGKHEKRILVVDSVAALMTEGEAVAGIEDANMRSDMDLPKFMSRLLRRWVGSAQVYNTLIVLVNQLREGPGKGFGDPTTTPGGNAPKFYSHVRVRVSRVAGSKIVDQQKVIGFRGVMKCLKNKAGGAEGSEIGYRLLRAGPLEFVPAKDVRDEGKA